MHVPIPGVFSPALCVFLAMDEKPPAQPGMPGTEGWGEWRQSAPHILPVCLDMVNLGFIFTEVVFYCLKHLWTLVFLSEGTCIKDHYTESPRNSKDDARCMDQCLKHLRADLGSRWEAFLPQEPAPTHMALVGARRQQELWALLPSHASGKQEPLGGRAHCPELPSPGVLWDFVTPTGVTSYSYNCMLLHTILSWHWYRCDSGFKAREESSSFCFTSGLGVKRSAPIWSSRVSSCKGLRFGSWKHHPALLGNLVHFLFGL